MESSLEPRDLVVLAADKNTEFAVLGLLARPQAVTMRAVSHRVLTHPERDPGCLRKGPEFLQVFSGQFRHALLVFDRDGSGGEGLDRETLEGQIEDRLRSDWGHRAAAVVIDPELENWVWSDSPHVETVLGWKERDPALRAWLKTSGHWAESAAKPARPKEAVEAALRQARKPRSSALYRQLAERVSFQRCTDPAFTKLCQTLQRWFPAGL